MLKTFLHGIHNKLFQKVVQISLHYIKLVHRQMDDASKKFYFPSLLMCRVGVVIYRSQLHIGLELPKLVLKLGFLTLGNHFTIKMAVLIILSFNVNYSQVCR